MADEAFYKADVTRDYKLTMDDGEGWNQLQPLDQNGDRTVTFNEFLAGADLPYPAWPGKVARNIVYKRIDGVPVLLDIYEPLVRKYDPAPVFYYTHGGGWCSGRKEISGHERNLIEGMSREGFVCICVMYRLVKMWNPNDEVRMFDCLVDCRDGLRFLKKHETELGLDMDRVVVFGPSAGGHIAQLLTFSDPTSFKGAEELAEYQVSPVAGISWYGPSDFRDEALFIVEGDDGNYAPDHWARHITKQDHFSYTDASTDVQETTEQLSPVWWLKKESAPLLHLHGDQDVIIPPKHAHHLEKTAQELGAPVDVIRVQGAGHGWWNKDLNPSRAAIEKRCFDFALQHIKTNP